MGEVAELIRGPGEVKAQIPVPIVEDKGARYRVLAFRQQFPRQYFAVVFWLVEWDCRGRIRRCSQVSLLLGVLVTGKVVWP